MERLLSMENNTNEMKKYCFCLLLLMFVQTKAHCQLFCTTLGETRKSIASCRIDTTLQLTHKKYAQFNFSKFAPVDGTIKENDFVEVGYDTRGKIREVVRHITMYGPRRFKFNVFEFETYRIMLLQQDLKSQDAFFFLSSVFILPKLAKARNYMVTFDPVDPGHSSLGLPGIWDTSPDRFRNFTSVSTLDQNLFTQVEYIFNNAQVFLRSQYKYYDDGSGRIEMKNLKVFLPTDENLKRKLDDSICLNDIEYAVTEDPDWDEIIYPLLDKKTESLPLCFSHPFEFR